MWVWCMERFISFRRTLVGLKHLSAGGIRPRDIGFRRTLVGLKRGFEVDVDGARDGFRRTLVGLKRRPASRASEPAIVSDEPLWG